MLTWSQQLDKVMTTLLVKLDPSFQSFVEDNGTDKALYGCVEAAALWYNDLRGTITKDGSVKMHMISPCLTRDARMEIRQSMICS